MSGLTEPLIYVIQTLGSLYLLIMLLRFILQLVGADFYNPLSQFVVRATQPLVRPLRRLVPSVGRLDLSSLLLALVIQFLLMLVVALLIGVSPILAFLPRLLIWSLLAASSLCLKVFFFALILSVILSWVAPGSYNPAAQLVEQICTPLLAPFRRFLPNLGGLDISPIFAFMAINLIDRFFVLRLAQETGMLTLFAPFM